MDQGSADLATLRALLRTRRDRAWLSAVSLDDGREQEGQLLYAQIVVGLRPHGWRDCDWSYESCTFASAVANTTSLSSLLSSHSRARLDFGSTVASFELPDSGVSWQRIPSLAAYNDLALPWPSTDYRLHLVNTDQSLRPPNAGYHVGQGEAPSFPTFGAAFRAFFHDDFRITGSSSPPTAQITVRVVDHRARISRVRIRPAALEVWVQGRDLAHARLELNGADDRGHIEVTKSGVLRSLCRTVCPPTPGSGSRLIMSGWITGH